jgi:hypothetical protein
LFELVHFEAIISLINFLHLFFAPFFAILTLVYYIAGIFRERFILANLAN